MKFGVRKPSLTRSIKARTTGRMKRALKKSVIPFYGTKGAGFIKNPKRTVYNSVYKKTTFGITDILKESKSPRTVNNRKLIKQDNISNDNMAMLLVEAENAIAKLDVLQPIINEINDFELYVPAYDEMLELIDFLINAKKKFGWEFEDNFKTTYDDFKENRIRYFNGAIEATRVKYEFFIKDKSEIDEKLKILSGFRDKVIKNIDKLAPSNIVYFYIVYKNMLASICKDADSKYDLDLETLINQANKKYEPDFSLDGFDINKYLIN